MPEGDRIKMYRPKKAPVPFTPERKQQCIEYMRNHPDFGGRRSLCAEAVGITGGTLAYHLKMDPDFHEAFNDAHQQWIDENLYSAALTRSVNGVVKPIMGGRFKDEVVGEIREYSDSLTLALLRASRADFREKGPTSTEPGGSAGGVMIVPSAPANMGEWQDLLGESATGVSQRPEPSE